MKHWARFYYLTGTAWSPIPGKDSVMKLDGRLSLDHMRDIAHLSCSARGYDGYKLMAGDTFLGFTPLSHIIPVTRPRE